MNILLTGSNGFIGRTIAAKLQGQAHIWGMGRQQTSQCEAVEHYVCADLSKGDLDEELCKLHFDAIIHVAANISMDDNDPDILMDNCIGTYWITRLARETGCKRLIYISSLPVVGTPQASLQAVSQSSHAASQGSLPATSQASAASEQVGITEESLPHPETVYHVSKLAGEYLVNLLRREGVQTTSLRIPSPIGVGMSPNTIFSVFLRRAASNQDITIRGAGTRRQNYLDVRDIADAVCLALTAQKLSSCYNIVAEETIANAELAQRVIRATHSSVAIHFEGTDPSDHVDWKADGSRAKRELGFSPKYTLEDTIAWMITEGA